MEALLSQILDELRLIRQGIERFPIPVIQPKIIARSNVPTKMISSIESQWLPVKLYGRIDHKETAYTFTFVKSIKRFPFTNQTDVDIAL